MIDFTVPRCGEQLMGASISERDPGDVVSRVWLFRLLMGFIGLIILAGPLIPQAAAQVNSSAVSINLSATLPASLTVSASPTSVSFALAASGTASGSPQISVTTAWALSNSSTTISLYAYCSSTAAALSDGSGDNIPSSSLLGSANSGTFTAFTGDSPFGAGTSLTIFSQSVSGTTLNTSRTDTLDLEIDTTGLNLPVGTYTGVLNLQAQAI